VTAGRRLFSAQGIYDARIEDITDQAGIAKGTLYLHFRNKQALVQEVVGAGFDELRVHVSRALAGRRDLESVTAAIVEGHLRFFVENPDLLRIFHQVRGVLKFDTPEWRGLRGPLVGHLEFLADALAIEEGLSSRRRRELAVLLFGSASGACSVLASARLTGLRRPSYESWSRTLASAVASTWTRESTRARTRVKPPRARSGR